ncbi:RRQRL motif-containing zinc-binding protein [Streptomyces sp. NPDC094461]|uniref:RRQRL motif-containing zinc-binding protein n=1 Tax=Streptomyces sp. NPDC094461 TaxID=3366064 RepID=UPI0037FDADB4
MSTVPVYRWRLAPDGYATRHQLRAMGLRPGGQDVAAQLERPRPRPRPRRRRGPLIAYLYRIDRARPVRPMTPARRAALAAAMAARRMCPVCRQDRGYCIPRSLGMCVACHDSPGGPALPVTVPVAPGPLTRAWPGA